MKYSDINKRFTEIVAEYLEKGYTINTATMTGSQSGERMHVDITDGGEIIRVSLREFRGDFRLRGIEIVTGSSRKVEPNSGDDLATIWNDDIRIIKLERFFEIGGETRTTAFYGTEEEAKSAEEKRSERRRRLWEREGFSKNVTGKYLDTAKRIIRRKYDRKRIKESDISAIRKGGKLIISYGGGVVCKIGSMAT